MEDATMGSTFDIFKVTSDGPLWVKAVQGLEKAKEQMAHLALSSPGEYFIHSQEEGVIAKQTQEFLEEEGNFKCSGCGWNYDFERAAKNRNSTEA
jgi:hypothetical protein